MKKTSRQLIEIAAEVLNGNIVTQTPLGVALAQNGEMSKGILAVVNEILKKAAEGGRLVAAVESDGVLLGFVPRADVPIPDLGVPNPPATGAPAHPDDPSAV
jgi:hypothetical protein